MINKYIDIIRNTEQKEQEIVLQKAFKDSFINERSKLANYLLQIEMRGLGLFSSQKHSHSLPDTDFYQIKIITLHEKKYELSVQFYYKNKKLHVHIKLSNETESKSKDLSIATFMKVDFEKCLISLLKQLDNPEKGAEINSKPTQWLHFIKKHIFRSKEG
ncbi:hypothetical protein [Chryseobacterium sp. G0201]|uniref:hypothetical protein n=1 Tax=Chryseobacterium sp. G0201 TaxID=2487065 RepID=UPI000F50C7E6|nr:hypothetical protein [Chryseobacterium sp. G0201]AZA54097.1 hypothetical protein EG348_14370 [Chryseobacterium sp. G0201]